MRFLEVFAVLAAVYGGSAALLWINAKFVTPWTMKRRCYGCGARGTEGRLYCSECWQKVELERS